MSAPTSHALKPFYRLRFIATGMSMLSAVLLPWLVYTATRNIAAAGIVMLIAVYLHGLRKRMLVENRRRAGA